MTATVAVFIWYTRRDSNPHGELPPTNFKSAASAYSATRANWWTRGHTIVRCWLCLNKGYYMFLSVVPLGVGLHLRTTGGTPTAFATDP